jgi:hypothetical protein
MSSNLTKGIYENDPKNSSVQRLGHIQFEYRFMDIALDHNSVDPIIKSSVGLIDPRHKSAKFPAPPRVYHTRKAQFEQNLKSLLDHEIGKYNHTGQIPDNIEEKEKLLSDKRNGTVKLDLDSKTKIYFTFVKTK